MLNEILEAIKNIISAVGFLPVIVVVSIIGLYIFWSESKKMGKNQNSIFDGFFLSALVSVIWGRVTFILANPGNYVGLPWSIVPYERYPDGFYVFRLLPWRYIRIWDGEFMFTGLFIGFILFAFIYAILIKKWRWREMISSILASSSSSLGLLLLIFGFVTKTRFLLVQGIVIICIIVAYFILSYVLGKILQKNNGKLWEKLNYILIGVFTLSVSSYTTFSILTSEITPWDRVNIQIFVGFSVLSFILFIIDVFRSSAVIKTTYSTRSVSISTNQPVKI